MPEGPATVEAPAGGLWRIGRGDDPLAIEITPRRIASGANRFDGLTMDYGVLYFATTLEACFGETLARFRPSIPMLALVEEEWTKLGFMTVGTVPSDWRQRRSAVNVRLPHGTRFVDIDSPQTHQFFRKELALGLASLGLQDLDVATVRGRDRRVTQLLSEWVYLNGDGSDSPVAGIRYESRIRSGWECWAIFDDEDLEMEVVSKVAITPEMPELVSVATLFEIQVF